MNERVSQEDLEKLKDYDRLRLEYTRLHEDYRRLLNIPVFSNRRELLIDFYSKQRGGINETNKDAIIREVDNYLSINCG